MALKLLICNSFYIIVLVMSKKENVYIKEILRNGCFKRFQQAFSIVGNVFPKIGYFF